MAKIYYSAGTDGTALYNANASASSGTLTLASAAADKIGIGDEIREGANRYYIYQRNSSTEFLIQTATGSTAITFSSTGITIYRAFSSVSAAENGASGASYLNTTDLTAAVGGGLFELFIIMYGDGADSTAVSINGWTTNATYFLTIRTPIGLAEVGTRQRHEGKLDATYAHFTNSSSVSGFIGVTDQNVHLEWLQIDGSGGSGYRRMIRFFGNSSTDSDGGVLLGCIGKGGSDTAWQNAGFALATDNINSTYYFSNCVLSDQKDCFEFYTASNTVYVNSCTCQNIAGGSPPGGFHVHAGDVTAKNCVAQDAALANSCFIGSFKANSIRMPTCWVI